MSTPPSRCRLWNLVLALCVVACCFRASASPVLLITNLPAYGVTANLQGCVLGANPTTQGVAVFIYVPGYGWVSKPTCAQPLTTIQPNGSWSANITTGGPGDLLATRVAALLVSNSYNQPCVLGLPALPTNVYAQAIAKAVITRPSPGVRFLSFSGYDWSVKNSAGPVGPGPNYFSDFTNNVWTDTNGWMHLRITHRSNEWQCAEIISSRTFGPGSYRFELNSSVDAINTNVTLGLFTYSDDPAFTDREIDVECGRWGDASDTNNAQFVVQPYAPANHLVRYRVSPKLTNTTHFFIWETNQVVFQAQNGAYAIGKKNVINSWVFTNSTEVPVSGDENVHLNLWLALGNPTDNNEVEVVIKSFNFVPLGAAPSVVLSSARAVTNAQFRCDFTSQPDFRYTVQTSSNLLQWQPQAVILATNSVLNFADTNATARAQYYRVVTAP